MDFRYKKKLFYILFGIIIAAICVFFLFNNYYFIYTVKGRSMEQVLYNNDRIIIKKLNGEFRLNRFDIILFQKKNKNESILMIKRVIGLPGDNIEIKRDAIFIDGKELKQPFLQEIARGDIIKDPKDFRLLKTPVDNFYLLGDNRELSKDSRFFGVIQRKDIIGKVLISYWPFKMVQ